MRLARLLSTLRLRLRSLFMQYRVERDLDDELRDHLEHRIETGMARGLTRQDAHAAAMRAFGGMEQIKEECRDVRGTNVVEHVIRDVRFAVRHFARKPVTSATIVLAFALGIGFNTAFFLIIQSFVNGPVPGVPRQESLVRIRGIDRPTPGRAIGREFSYPEYQQYAALRTFFSDVAAWTSSDVVLGVGPGGDDLHSGAATYVTPNYFQVLGIRPILGAGLPIDAADAGPPVLAAVISDALWERHFQRAPDVIARTITVNGFAVQIAGVAPRRFAGARTGGSQMRVWLPLNARPHIQRTASTLADYDVAHFGIVARLQPGLEAEDANAAVQTIAASVAQHVARGPSGAAASTDVVQLLGANYFPPSGSEDEGVGRLVAPIFSLLILLIPCTTAGALLAGLAITRRREIAVRLALGASRLRVVRQLVTESVLLAIAAGATGLFVIWLLVKVFDASIPNLVIEFDWRAMAFTFSLGVLAGILFGISPAISATRLALSDALKDSTGASAPARMRLQAWLVVAQIAVTQPALLVMGTLLLEVRSELGRLPSQVNAERMLAVRFSTNPRYGSIDRRREETIQRVQTRLAAVPGVEAVVAQESWDDGFDVDVHPSDRAAGTEASSIPVRARAAPAGYFQLMGMSFVRGRDFDASEYAAEGGVVINADLARAFWGAADPIGRRLVAVGRAPGNATTFTVIGVVEEAGDRRRANADEGSWIFVPRVRTTGHLLVRTQGPAEALTPTIRSAAAAEAPDVPVIGAETLASVEASERRSIVTAAAIAGGTGALALLLSAIGLYAVAAVAVGQRVREIGIRTALGATSDQVVRLFVRRGLRLSLAGLAIGLPLGIAGVRLLTIAGQSPLAGIEAVSAFVAAVVIGVAFVASWIPARRAARVDPLEVLRVE